MFAGDSQPLDVCSVHHNNTFLRYSVSLLGYGFYGDVLTDSEKKRWMGPARYDLSGRNACLNDFKSFHPKSFQTLSILHSTTNMYFVYNRRGKVRLSLDVDRNLFENRILSSFK